MLTLKDIIKNAKMMEQTGGEYRGFHEDHIPEHYDSGFREPLSPRDEAIVLSLGYEVGSDGDLRIVQK